jgi:hypothetical protein
MSRGRLARVAVRTVVAAAGSVVLLAGLGWLGLQVRPAPFPPHPERTRELVMAEMPSDLPEPVERHFRATLGERVPRIETAVVWGRGRFNLYGLMWFPTRFKSYNVAGHEFRRDIELTWFGMPIFRGYDAYLNGKGILKITGLFGGSTSPARGRISTRATTSPCGSRRRSPPPPRWSSIRGCVGSP